MRKLYVCALSVILTSFFVPMGSVAQERQRKVVRARVQAHPGGPIEDVEMEIHEAPPDSWCFSAR